MIGARLLDLMDGVLPGGRGVLALLYAYFDESGTHGSATNIMVAGFVGSKTSWRRLQRDWKAVLARDQVECFHYTDLRYARKSYKGWDATRKARHLDDLARVIGASGVVPVVACFSGDWSATTAGDDHWNERFPSAYSWCFEAAVKALERVVADRFSAQPIVVSMCAHEQYGSRAVEVFDHFKFNGAWSGIVSLNYIDPKAFCEAQAADMIAWEVQRDLNQASAPPSQHLPLPLLDKVCAPGRTFSWLRYDEAALINQMASPRGAPMKRPANYLTE
jgi:hypothetical protein